MTMHTDGQPDGLRARKRQQTRQKIVGAALALFYERGFEGTTVDDIVASADVARRTFFHYFTAKEDVVVDAPLRAVELTALVGERPVSEPPAVAAENAYREFMDRLYGIQRADALSFARLIVETPGLQDRVALTRLHWAASIAAGLEQRLGPADRDLTALQIVANVTVWTFAAAINRFVAEAGSRPAVAIIDEAFALLRGGRT